MQYTKFMANLYRYDGSNAKEISGVTRFETIGKNIKLTLKLCFAKRVNGTVDVFLLSGKSGQINGNLIFTGRFQQRTFSMQNVILEEQLKQNNINLNDIKGVYIVFDNSRIFAALWDSKDVNIENVNLIETQSGKTESEKTESGKTESDKSQTNRAELDRDENAQTGEAESESMSGMRKSSELKDSVRSDSSGNERKTINIENVADTEKSAVTAKKDSILASENNKNNITKMEACNEEIVSDEQFKCNLMKLRELPQAVWNLGNNSFLLHGYYNYHYIYVKKETKGWLIGVPGVFYPQEEMVAGTFGFSEFMPVSDDKKQKGVFGYWCKSVEISE